MTIQETQAWLEGLPPGVPVINFLTTADSTLCGSVRFYYVERRRRRRDNCRVLVVRVREYPESPDALAHEFIMAEEREGDVNIYEYADPSEHATMLPDVIEVSDLLEELDEIARAVPA